MFPKRPYVRSARITPSLQQGLAKILASYYPVLPKGLLTVNEVQLSQDLSFAKVFISILYFEQTVNKHHLKDYLAELNRQVPKIRHLLTTEVKLRYIPGLLFMHDATPEAAEKINKLLQTSTQQSA